MLKIVTPLLALFFFSFPVQADTKTDEMTQLWKEYPRTTLKVTQAFWFCTAELGLYSLDEAAEISFKIINEHLTPPQYKNLSDTKAVQQYIKKQGGCYKFVEGVKAASGIK